MISTGKAIIEYEPGVYYTVECSGDCIGSSSKIEKAHIMKLEYAKEEVRRLHGYIDNRGARVIELYADV